MADVDLWVPTRIVFGEGSLNRIVPNIESFGARKAFVVSDPIIGETDGVKRLLQLLRDQRIEPSVFTSVEPNPTTQNVRDGLDLARQVQPDFFVAVGGGSVIDAAKAINLVLANGGAIEDYVGQDRARQPGKPLLAVPTTAGTGSEVSKFAIITDQAGDKMVINDSRNAPWLAVVDPELTYTCPPSLTAAAGMDAITHAVESYTSRSAKVMTEPLSFAALRLLAANIRTAVMDGQNREARRAMAAGSNMVAIGMGYAGLGICHSLANPLTRQLGLGHGMACAMVLPWVLRFNWPANPPKFAQVADAWVGGGGQEEVVDRGREFLAQLGLPTRLSQVGLKKDMIPGLIPNAMQNPANRSNARDVTPDDLAGILEQAL